ncbi:MAG: HlyD family efflux transporter periplasmic adaptor subunit [Candidatus Eremiobacteraeota bacterium]|nr:HlyD family efflux transporter periplasmic adaptor subunit [Candidatus Eremiobacteraeota bacterium]
MRRLAHVASLAAAAAALCACGGHAEDLYSGTLQANSAAVGSTVGGRVASVPVSDGAPVQAGQIVLRFEDDQERAALAGATARLAQARSALADLRAGTRPEDLARAAALAEQQRAQYEAASATQPYQATVARSQVRQSSANLADARAAAVQARADADRMRSLFATGDISAQQRDAAVARERQANAQLANRAAGVRAARAQAVDTTAVSLPQTAAAALAAYRAAQEQYRSLAAGPRPAQVRQAEDAVRAAQADAVAAQVRLDETLVRAPASGVVTALDLHPGDLVAPNAPIATIDARGDPYARVYVPQEKLGHVAVGAHVTVTSDALPNVHFDGVVEQLDSQAQFTPQDVQTASDRAVLSFGVKVRVHDPRGALHAGTTVAVAVP